MSSCVDKMMSEEDRVLIKVLIVEKDMVRKEY